MTWDTNMVSIALCLIFYLNDEPAVGLLLFFKLIPSARIKTLISKISIRQVVRVRVKRIVFEVCTLLQISSRCEFCNLVNSQ